MGVKTSSHELLSYTRSSKFSASGRLGIKIAKELVDVEVSGEERRGGGGGGERGELGEGGDRGDGGEEGSREIVRMGIRVGGFGRWGGRVLNSSCLCWGSRHNGNLFPSRLIVPLMKTKLC